MAGPSVLITGATGFLGRWSIPALLKRGYSVHAVGSPRSISQRPFPAEISGAIPHVLDLLDLAAVCKLIEEIRPSHLLHFAWYAVPGAYWTSLDNFTWVAASLHLIQRFHAAGGRRAVIAGTCAEYDWSRATLCDEQSTPVVLGSLSSASPYAICKAALQRMLDSYARTAGLSLAWGRIFFQYGPYEPESRLVPSVICALLRGERAACSDVSQVRSFLYSQDVGEAFAALLDCNVEGPVNIGADGEISIAELVRTIGLLIGRPELIALGTRPMLPNEPPYLLPDLTRLRREVGWQPLHDLETGLRKTIGWWLKKMEEPIFTGSSSDKLNHTYDIGK